MPLIPVKIAACLGMCLGCVLEKHVWFFRSEFEKYFKCPGVIKTYPSIHKGTDPFQFNFAFGHLVASFL